VKDFRKCRQDCISCSYQELVPDTCDGACSSCESVDQCPCCNRKLREELLEGDMTTDRYGEPQEVDIEISQISYPAPWQRRSISNGLAREMAKDLRENGQLRPIKLRPRASKNGKTLYQPVDGHARIRGARYAGWATIRAVVKQMDDYRASVEYLLDNMAERDMPWEEVALGILAVEKALTKKLGHRCHSRVLARVLGRSKDWVNDHKRALRMIQDHEIPRGTISHHKLLRPLTDGIPFPIEETILQGIINEKWTVQRVREEVMRRCGGEALQPGGATGRTL